MVFARKKLLFFFDQYFSVRLGEKLYKYDRTRDNLSWFRSVAALVIAYFRLKKKKIGPAPTKQFRNIFYLDTINQRNSVLTVLRRMDKGDTLVVLYEEVNDSSLAAPGMPDNFCLDARALYLRSIVNLPMAVCLARVVRRKYIGEVTAAHIYINLALFLAAVHTLKKLLVVWKPVSVTVVNDHNLFALAMAFSANQLGIKTIYIQHASVSGVFPKIVTDVALLEGQHSRDVYDSIGNYARENLLVGIPRLDGFIGYKTPSSFPSQIKVGLCLKPFFPTQLISSLISALRSSAHVGSIVLRPHPGSSASYQDYLRKEFGLPFSNARIENSTQFLQSVDVIVSCESTIILESALMRIPAIYFDDGSFFYPFDLYGFVKNGVAAGVAKAPEDLPQIINQLSTDIIVNNFVNCKYYCSTVNSDDENKSSDLLLNYYEKL